MGESWLRSLLNSGISPSSIVISDQREDRLRFISNRYHCMTLDSVAVSRAANIIFLIVKPQDLDDLLLGMGLDTSIDKIVVSFVAGRTTSSIEKYFNEGVPVIRVMPNTSMSVGMGASGISAGKYATEADVKAVEELLNASGKTIVVDEYLQDAITATSGSGPAYFFRFVEAMIAGAQDLGLSEADARTLVIQTITGAAAMLNQEGVDPGVLRQNVTSPNGTTYAALQVFEGGDLEGLVKRAMRAARDRSQELS